MNACKVDGRWRRFGREICGRYVGKVTKVNTTKSDNVTADFDDGPGDFCAHADTYGVDNTWVVLTHSRGGGAGAGGAGRDGAGAGAGRGGHAWSRPAEWRTTRLCRGACDSLWVKLMN